MISYAVSHNSSGKNSILQFWKTALYCPNGHSYIFLCDSTSSRCSLDSRLVNLITGYRGLTAEDNFSQ